MVRPSKRRRYDDGGDGQNENQSHPIFNEDLSVAATTEEKEQWQGFCEIESEPAFFNVMMKEFGVQGVRVQEIFGLDESMLSFLPHPVYGLIFLFRLLEENDDKKEEESGCPDHIWFANQTTGNACATVALLNIINNLPEIELGENLQNFRTFTRDFAPPLRGEQITHFEFIKQIHNSFARKLDMMNIDLAMKHNMWKRSGKGKNAADDEEAGFHFIAFIPIDGEVWELDGLDRQPHCLGPYQDSDWLSIIAPVLGNRMEAYEEDGIEFGLLGVVKDPIVERRSRLAENINTIADVEKVISVALPGWQRDRNLDPSELTGASVMYGITDDLLAKTGSHGGITHAANAAVAEPDRLIALREQLANDQIALRAAVKEEEQVAHADEERASSRRSDFGPMIRKWLRLLAEKDLLRPLIDDLD